MNTSRVLTKAAMLIDSHQFSNPYSAIVAAGSHYPALIVAAEKIFLLLSPATPGIHYERGAITRASYEQHTLALLFAAAIAEFEGN